MMQSRRTGLSDTNALNKEGKEMKQKKRTAVAAQSPNLNGSKDSKKITQIQLLTQCFSGKPKTMYQAEKETGVRIANICRFVDKLKKKGILRKVSFGKCPISHRQAGFYTSNCDYFPETKEPSLFDLLWKGGGR